MVLNFKKKSIFAEYIVSLQKSQFVEVCLLVALGTASLNQGTEKRTNIFTNLGNHQFLTSQLGRIAKRTFLSEITKTSVFPFASR